MLSVKVSNSGFAPVYRSMKCTLYFTDSEENVFEHETDADLSKELEFKTVIPEKVFDELKMPVSIPLKTVRRYDDREIYFVNTLIEDGRVYLGELF